MAYTVKAEVSGTVTRKAIVAGVVGLTGTVQGNTDPASGGVYILPAATKALLGGVIVGDNLDVETNGRLSVHKDNVSGALGFAPKDLEEMTNQDILDIFNS